MLAYTGMRLAEVINLQWHDVDLAQSVIRITKSKSKGVRAIPINPRLKEWMEKLPPDTGYVFGDGTGQRLYSDSWYWKLLREATETCELPPARLHDFRHTFGATLAMSGVPLPTIMELMGHSTIQTTLIYIHFAPKHLQKAIESLTY